MFVQMPASSELFKEKAKVFRESACLDTLSLVANPVVQRGVAYWKVMMHRNVGFELVVVHHQVFFIFCYHCERMSSVITSKSSFE